MSNLPTWIVSELRHGRQHSEAFAPNLRYLNRNDLKIPKVIKNSPRVLNFRKIPKTYLKKNRDPYLEPLEFKNKCIKFWSKFDSRVSPILQKYSPTLKRKAEKKLPYYSPQLQFYKNANKNRPYHIRRSSNPIHFSDSTDEECNENGIQCDLMSDSSENEVKVRI